MKVIITRHTADEMLTDRRTCWICTSVNESLQFGITLTVAVGSSILCIYTFLYTENQHIYIQQDKI